VPVLLRTSNRFSPPVVSSFTKLKLEFVTEDVPDKFHSLTSPSPGWSPKPVMVLLAIVRSDTFCPLMPTCAPPAPPLPFMFKLVTDTVDTLLMLMPAWAALLKVGLSMLFTVPLPLLGLVKFMFESERLLVDVNSAPCTVFWMVPPEPAVVPIPVTVRPPLDPVLLSTMPLTAPFAEMLWNVTLAAPIVELVMK